MWNFPILPESASSVAPDYDFAFWYEVAVGVFFTLFVLVLVLGLANRYRRGRQVDRSHPPTHSLKLEALWIGVPLVIAMSMFGISAVLYIKQFSPPGDAVEIPVVGKQWMWKLQHPEGKKEINELHLPVGQAVRLKMISQDVIHSFFIPAFRVKQDVLPGRYTEMWFRPTKIGRYRLFCTEYCGTDHSVMGGWVEVMSQADYERWLATEQAGESLVEEGRRLFVLNHCAGCHGENATVQAPRLEGVYGRPVPIQVGDRVEFVQADDRYIRDSILLPKSQVVAGYQPIMPSYQGQLSEEDLLKIIAYIKAIGNRPAPGPAAQPQYDADRGIQPAVEVPGYDVDKPPGATLLPEQTR
ncbi:MAG: cytochrome c oxidase subunit 2 [Isosphaeraceae bacterium]|jgi:cytochrome c oxidase subunit 2|nr:MAG: cytochrome c oxidase subunit 2 [Isosphaeraceae bacterium]